MNDIVIARANACDDNKRARIVENLREIAPELSKDKLVSLYDKSVSVRQSIVNSKGKFLERTIAEILKSRSIPYKEQVRINTQGNVDLCSRNNTYCIVDLVVGRVADNTSIKNYVVLSCKTTCRERWTQDSWSLKFPPRLFLLLTLSNDYPSSERFGECSVRKILTCCPKSKDDRIYKLNYNHLIQLVKPRRRRFVEDYDDSD